MGYGLEPILPDGKVGGFGREAVPYLKRGDYDGAVSLLASRVVDVIAKDARVEITTSQPRRIEPLTSAPRDDQVSAGAIIAIIIVIIIVLAVPPLRRLLFYVSCSGVAAVAEDIEAEAIRAVVVSAVEVVSAVRWRSAGGGGAGGSW